MSEVKNIDSQVLGKLLQIAFSKGVFNQLSEEVADFEKMKIWTVGNPDGRELRFSLKEGRGPSAIQWGSIAPASSGAAMPFPNPQRSLINEYTAKFKELDATVELEYNLWKRMQKASSKYISDALTMEVEDKQMNARRRLCADLYGDGTGIIGTIGTSGAAHSGGNLVLTIDAATGVRGHIGWFEFGEIMNVYADDTTKRLASASDGTVEYLKVVDIDRAAKTVTFEAYSAAHAKLTVDGVGTIVDTDLVYREGQVTKYNVSSSITDDFNMITEVMAGYESLFANDGRKVHGITMSGVTKGTVKDCSGATIDTPLLQSGFSLVKNIVGKDAYKYGSLLMASEVLDMFYDGKEPDRRFNSAQDNVRGGTKFSFLHGNDNIALEESPYCPIQRMYAIPDAKSGKKILELYKTDFEPVRPGGQGSEYHLKPASGGGHEKYIRWYMTAMFSLLCKHPASVLVFKNFSLT